MKNDDGVGSRTSPLLDPCGSAVLDRFGEIGVGNITQDFAVRSLRSLHPNHSLPLVTSQNPHVLFNSTAPDAIIYEIKIKIIIIYQQLTTKTISIN